MVTITINSPIRPTPHETATHVSQKSIDRSCAAAVKELYSSFVAKCSNPDPLEPFLEWIVAQLELSDPQPSVHIGTTLPIKPGVPSVCANRDDCMHFMQERDVKV